MLSDLEDIVGKISKTSSSDYLAYSELDEEVRDKLQNSVRKQVRSSTKYIRDPIHDIIEITDNVVLDVLDSSPMQRLRRITQLPFTSLVYPGAEHSRFTHSLGVYHLACRMLKRFDESDKYKSDDYLRLVVKLAALLHDVGHGPFSHLFERFISQVEYLKTAERSHETWSQAIVLKQTELCNFMDSIDKRLKFDVQNMLAGTFSPRFLCTIVSSQFDADRLDYMLRDSFMTGVHYGRFDLNWLFRNLDIAEVDRRDEDGRVVEGKEQKIVIDVRRGLSCLEEYLLGNLYLYRNVYFHKKVIAAENMMINILVRAVDLLKNGDNLDCDLDVLYKIAFNRELTIHEYLSMDDIAFLAQVRNWADHGEDRILRRLCCDLISRKVFKSIVPEDQELSKKDTQNIVTDKTNALKVKELDPKYFLVRIETDRKAYKSFYDFWIQKKPMEEIWCRKGDGDDDIVHYGTLREKSDITKAILDLKEKRFFICFPEEVE